jgi:hypothetical protein
MGFTGASVPDWGLISLYLHADELYFERLKVWHPL